MQFKQMLESMMFAEEQDFQAVNEQGEPYSKTAGLIVLVIGLAIIGWFVFNNRSIVALRDIL